MAAATLAALSLATTAAAQEGRPTSIEDVLAFNAVGSVELSPDGRWVAYVVTKRDLEENAYNADVWIVAADGGDPVQLTRGSGFDGDPAWAPDGSWLAFRSDRGERSQVYGITPGGGEAWEVTDHETGVDAFRISSRNSGAGPWWPTVPTRRTGHASGWPTWRVGRP
jgi:Tol biopolymer transport system component